jgi:hypothetical protein
MPISRRDFLRLSALGVGSAMLGGCARQDLPRPGASLTTAARVTAVPTGRAGSGSELAEILGRPTDQAVTVNVLPVRDAEFFFEYGTAPGRYDARTQTSPAAAGKPINGLIDKLQANTRYYFRSCFRSQDTADFAAGDEHSFVTQRKPGAGFRFTIDADPHNRDPNFNPELYAIALGNALADRPDFHIDLGDTFMTEKLGDKSREAVAGSYLDMRPHLALIGAEAPLFLVNGNHDGELGWLLDGSDQSLPVRCTAARQAYFPNPAPNGFYTGSTTEEPFIGVRDGYYAWTWGEALFVALDPFWYTLTKMKPQVDSNWGWTVGEQQYQWLKKTLESSHATYKFVFIHNLVGGMDKDGRGGIEAAPFYEWGGQNRDGSMGFAAHRPGWEMPIHALLVKNKVSAVFHGHDHVFVRQELDGVVYQECPQPSITRYNNTQLAQQYGYSHGDVRSSSGHLRVSVAPAQATVEYVRAYRPQDETPGQKNGQVDFQYTIAGS